MVKIRSQIRIRGVGTRNQRSLGYSRRMRGSGFSLSLYEEDRRVNFVECAGNRISFGVWYLVSRRNDTLIGPGHRSLANPWEVPKRGLQSETRTESIDI